MRKVTLKYHQPGGYRQPWRLEGSGYGPFETQDAALQCAAECGFEVVYDEPPPRDELSDRITRLADLYSAAPRILVPSGTIEDQIGELAGQIVECSGRPSPTFYIHRSIYDSLMDTAPVEETPADKAFDKLCERLDSDVFDLSYRDDDYWCISVPGSVYESLDGDTAPRLEAALKAALAILQDWRKA